MNFKLKRIYPRKQKHNIKPKIIFCNDEEKIKIFNENLEKLSNKITNYDKLIEVFDESSLIFKTKKKTSEVISLKTKEMICNREYLRSMKNSDQDNYNEFIKVRKKCKRMIRNDVYRFEIKQLEMAISNNTKWKHLKNGITSGKKMILKMKDKFGVMKFKREEILEVASNFYEELYKSNLSENEISNLSPELNENTPFEKFTIEDLNQAIFAMKNGKSTGEDNIPIELFKNCDEKYLLNIVDIFNNIIETEDIPKNWLCSTIILIHKKGSTSDINNYRPITLTDHLYKLFMRMILQKSTNMFDEHLSVNQAGFRHDYSTVDHLFVIQQIIEKHKEFNKDVAIAFVDFTKAFDSIEHPFLWQSLKNNNINEKFIRVVKKIYDNSEAQVRIDNDVGRKFKIRRGIKQGDPLSPKQFTSTLEYILNSLDKSKGVKIENDYLIQLSFADDVAIISDNLKKLEEILSDLDEKSRKIGLSISYEKTKILTNIENNTQHLTINNNQVDFVKSFKYLGQEISFENSTELIINNRISAAWKSFWSHKKFFKSKLPMFHKKRLFDACVLPTFTYGCQTWSLTQHQKEKFQIAQRSMERQLMNVKLKDKISNEKLRKKTKVVDVRTKISELKWNWAGHFQRHTNELRWPKIIEKWEPKNGKRRRGAPQTRWRDEIFKFGGDSFWRKKARNRNLWKIMGNEFVQN